MGLSPKKSWQCYFVISPAQVAQFTWSGFDKNGVPYEMHPVPMLNGNYALAVSNLNIPPLDSALFVAMSALTPQVVTCCDFVDHGGYHQEVLG